MELFVRESGPVDATAVIFLHGGRMSGWSWNLVVARMPHYHCLVPDLPQYGKSFRRGPFGIDRAADSVAGLIRTRTATGRAHVVGFSLGAQVGLTLLARYPEVVARAVLVGTMINTLPGPPVARVLLGLPSRTAWFRDATRRQMDARRLGVLSAWADDYRRDVRRLTSSHMRHIVMESAGFTPPVGIAESPVPTLFLTGAREKWFVHRWAGSLAASMPNGAAGVADDMGHDWPLRHPELFAPTVEGWITGAQLPPAIKLADREA